MLKKKENIRSVIELFSYIVRVALFQIFCFTMYQKKKERYSIRLRSLEGRMLQERKIEDWCGRRRRSTIDLEAKYDKEGIPLEMYQDVSMIIVQAEAIFLFAVASAGLTSSRSNFYGIPRGSFYGVERSQG